MSTVIVDVKAFVVTGHFVEVASEHFMRHVWPSRCGRILKDIIQIQKKTHTPMTMMHFICIWNNNNNNISVAPPQLV